MWLKLLLLIFGVGAQDDQCPEDKTPKQLAAVSVWMQDAHNGSLRFRISDEDLLDQGFSRSPYDRDSAIIMMAEHPGSCPVGACLMKLTANRRVSDGVLIQQENVFGPPSGFISMGDEMFCARKQGDCGAEMPVYRFTKGRPDDMIVGYSIDPVASIPGYWRDAKPICYGWSDSGSIVTAHGNNSKDCVRLQEIKNAKIRYSYPGSGAYFPVGTTASVACNRGFAAGGSSIVLCTQNGWYPGSGLGYCVKQNVSSRLASTGLISSGSASQLCAPSSSIENAQISYTQLQQNGRFPAGTTASVVCSTGYTVSTGSRMECLDGKWSREQWPKCVKSEKVKCQPMIEGPNGQIIYNSSTDPLTLGSNASLRCDLGFVPIGTVKAECTETGWKPPSLGICQLSSSATCTAVAPLGGTPSYVQSNPTVPYSAGTSVLLICNPGYILSGSASAICLNALWSPPIGSCSPTGFGITVAPGLNAGNSGASCIDFAPQQSGNIQYTLQPSSTGTHPTGTLSTLTCNLGTTVSGPLASTCQNGIWSPVALGQCLATSLQNSLLECANPVVPNGQITYSQSTAAEPQKPVGSVATIICNLGYNIQGIGSLTCQSSGIWSPLPPMCIASGIGVLVPSVQCPIMGTPLSGTVSYSSLTNPTGPFNTGTVATLVCNAGTIASGPISASCTTTGAWSPFILGPCNFVLGGFGFGSLGGQCFPLGLGLGGTIRYSAGPSTGPFNTGTIATIFCDLGKVLSGPASASCNGGVWSPATIGPCIQSGLPGSGVAGIGGTGLQCPALFTPAPGIINYSLLVGIGGTYPSGTIATVVCTSGVVSGAGSASCLNGVWTPAVLGTCPLGGAIGLNSQVSTLAPGTGCPVMIPNLGVSITYSNGATIGPFASGTLATAACTTFGQAVQGAMSATCFGTTWSTVLGSCSTGLGGINTTPIGSCLFGIGAPLGATLVYSNNLQAGPFPSGTVANAKCGAFSTNTLGGVQTSMCLSGVWSPPSITGCSAQADPPVTGGVSTGVTSNACPVISVPFGSGQVNYSTGIPFLNVPSGSTATLTCTSGTVQGSPISSCFNGQWTPVIGNCSIGTPGLVGAQCTTPPPMPSLASAAYSNGATMFGPWPEGTTATINCPFGQVAIGVPTLTCRSGNWGQSSLSCSPNGFGATTAAPGLPGSNCLPMLVPANGNITYSQGGTLGPFPVGSQATLTCNPPFTVVGTQFVSCLNGQWTTAIGSCSPGGTNGAVTGASGTNCLAASVPPFGTINYSQGPLFGPFPSGSQATLSCPPSFSVLGSQSSSCQNGQWLPALGNCTTGTITTANPLLASLTCVGPFNPFGSVNYSQPGMGPFPSGTSATMTCNPPFSLQGIATSSCSSGLWNPPLGNCQIGGVSNTGAIGTGTGITCPAAPSVPLYGTMSYSQAGPIGPFPQGTTASVFCSLGWSLVGAGTTSCSNGQWNPPLGNCTNGLPNTNPTTNSPGLGNGATCPVLFPASGTMSYSQAGPFGPFPQGTTASFTCFLGFSLVGSGTTSCSNGQWIPPLGNCTSGSQIANPNTNSPGLGNGATCPVVFPASGTMTYSQAGPFGPFPQGTTASVLCFLGFSLSGAGTTSCSNGQWNPPLGTCTSGSQIANPNTNSLGSVNGATCPAVFPAFGSMSYSQLGFGPFPQGTTASITCSLGFSLVGAGTTSCSNGQWNPPLGNCTSGSPVTNSITGNQPGSQCTASIPPVGFGTTTFSNGQFLPPWPQGATVTLQCLPSFTINGSASSTCTNGQWNPAILGNCSAPSAANSFTQCQAVPMTFSGTVQYSPLGPPFNEGTTATLSCNPGTTVSGLTTATCRSGGWSPFPGLGSCVTSVQRNPTRSVNPSLRNESCPSPSAPPFSEITFSNFSEHGMFAPLTEAVMECVLGYTAQGVTKSICQEGSFRPLLGNCRNERGHRLPGTCMPLAAPLNGVVSYIQASKQYSLEVGTIALLSCQNNYAVTGTATVHCTPTGWSPSQGFGQCDQMGNHISE